MKMLNCPECGLTIPDSLEDCPKCHTNIEDITREAEIKVQATEIQLETETAKTVKQKKDRSRKKKDTKEASTTNTDQPKNVKEEMIKAVEKAEEEIANSETKTDDSIKIKEEMIAAVVEAEALAAIEEEATNANLCKACMAPVEEGQDFCQLCGATIKSISEAQTATIAQTNEALNQWIAAIGYIVCFLPILLGSHRRSKFVKYHAKQAILLFITSIVFFLGLVVLRNIVDSLFSTSSIIELNEFFDITDTSWRHGSGVLFHYYLTWMIYALHFMPFVLMATGFINALQGKKRKLPFVGRFLDTKSTN